MNFYSISYKMRINIKNRFLLFFILLIFYFPLDAQTVDSTVFKSRVTKRSFCLMTSYFIGAYSYADIGLSKNSVTMLGYHPFNSAYFASTEIKLGDKLIVGQKSWCLGNWWFKCNVNWGQCDLLY